MDTTIHNGAISIIHKKFKNLIIPAGLGLYDMDSNRHAYDVNNYNEPVHNSLYDKLLELASFKGEDKEDASDKAVGQDDEDVIRYAERKKKKEDKEKPLQIQPVMTKRHKVKINKTKKRKHVKA